MSKASSVLGATLLLAFEQALVVELDGVLQASTGQQVRNLLEEPNGRAQLGQQEDEPLL